MFEVFLRIDDTEKVLTTFPREDLAEDFCKEMGWSWEDAEGLIWELSYREVTL